MSSEPRAFYRVPLAAFVVFLLFALSVAPSSPRQVTASIHTDSIHVANLPGYVYYSNDAKNTVGVLNYSTLGKVTAIGLNLTKAGPLNPCFSGATHQLYVPDFGTYSRGKVSIVDTSTNTLVGRISINGTDPWTCAYNPSLKQILVADYGSANISVISSSNTLIRKISVGDYPDGLAFDSANQTMFVSCGGNSSRPNPVGSIWVIEGRTDAVVATLNLGNATYPSSVAYDPIHDRVYADGGNRIWTFDASNYTLLGVTKVSSGTSFPENMAFDRWDDRLYLVGASGILVFDPQNKTIVGTYFSSIWFYGISIGPHPREHFLFATDYTDVYEFGWRLHLRVKVGVPGSGVTTGGATGIVAL